MDVQKKPTAAKKPKAAEKSTSTSASGKSAAKKKAASKVKPGRLLQTESECADIRAAVDGVLSNASGGQIQPSTAGNRLLRLFILPDKVSLLYRPLNQALRWHPEFSPFTSNEIITSWSVGDVRKSAVDRCKANCPS